MTTPLARIVFGCEQLGGTDWGAVDVAQVQNAVRLAWEAGIAAYDTADAYGLGNSERRLAAALGARRHDAFIITKGGVRWEWEQGRTRARTWCDNSPEYLARAIENSLRRLRIDVIPLYFVHWPDQSTSLSGVLDALREARHRGRIQGFGLANFTAEAVLECGPATGIEAVQASYNLLSEDAELDALDRFGSAGLERYGYGALAQGLLTGKYGPDTRFGDDDRRHRLKHFEAESWPRTEALLRQLARIAESMGRNVAQVALQAARQSGFVEHVIVGIKRPAQVHDLCGLEGWRLAEGDLRALMNAARQPARTVAG